jgi:GDP-4-dehydro-6-deoxy-D-mannose reductase
MKVLLTGAEGFIGRHLARELLSRGHSVTGTFLMPISVPPDSDRFDCLQLDLTDRASITELFSGRAFDRVVHLAGRSHVGSSWNFPAAYFEANVSATEWLLDAMPEHCSMVFSSSAEVYGIVPENEQPIDEQRPLRPINPYGLTKAAAERIVLRSGAVVARSFNLIGPGQSKNFALPNFAAQLSAIERGDSAPVLSVGNLEAQRDFLHVRDGVRALRVLVEEGISGQAYNVASGRPRAIQELLDKLCEVSGLEVRVQSDPDRLRPSDNPVVCGSADKLRALGWLPELTVEDAIRDLWLEAQHG